MDRRKTPTRRRKSSLTFLLLFLAHPLYAQEFFVGTVSQLKGETTFLHFERPHKLETINLEDKIRTGGSYLTHDRANLTLKLSGSAWLRASVNTKFALDFDPTSKSLTVNLLTGSIKVLFSSFKSKQKISKFIVKSADAVLETVEGKFSVVRNNLTDETSIYVEKGAVTAGLSEVIGQVPAVPVHARETVTLVDRKRQYEGPRELEQKEMKFLNSLFYIGGKSDELD